MEWVEVETREDGHKVQYLMDGEKWTGQRRIVEVPLPRSSSRLSHQDNLRQIIQRLQGDQPLSEDDVREALGMLTSALLAGDSNA